MALFGKSNKNDVKLAKIELEKQKLAQKNNKKMSKEQKRLAMIEQAKAVAHYTINNFQSFYSVVTTLFAETNELIEKINSVGDEKLSHKERSELRECQNSATENLKYLYLSKEYFVFVNKVQNNLPLNDNQYIYINKFQQFFDGVKVLDIDDDYDDSVLGMFKDVGKDILGTFVSTSNEFDFEDYLESYNDKIRKYIIPNFEQFVPMFVKTNIKEEVIVEEKFIVEEKASVETNKIKCSSCGFELSLTSKFCPECGTKIEIPKKKFCSECGTQLQPGAKFCPECGTKAN